MPTIGVLAKRWTTAKDMIRQLQEELVQIETEMLPMVESVEGGSRTSHVDGYKFVVKRPVLKSFDLNVWESIKGAIPSTMHPIKTKLVTELDNEGCEWLKENHPEYWEVMTKAITEKPGKTGFAVEVDE